MNYRHIFHAGSFADAFKHIVLVALIQALLQKEKPFCYLDTHAGIGSYDLQSEAAQKTREFETGISRLLAEKNLPTAIQDYLNCIKTLNNSITFENNFPRFYPGSPYLARHFLRSQDKIILTELHKEDVQQLQQEFLHDRQVIIHQQDGYQALKAYLPPLERRGLVLIDPPYEKTNEVETLCKALQAALQRWETGIYAIWYPIKDRIAVNHLHRSLKNTTTKNILVTELSIYPDDAPLSLNGSGLAIINPPWQLDKQLISLLPSLWRILSPQGLGGYQVEWLNNT